MSDREPDEISKIETEGQFGEGQTRLKRAIFTLPPRLGPALDPVLRRPRKIRFVIENRFQNGARVVEGKSNAEREQARQEQHLFHPGPGMKFALRANVKDRNRH